MGRGGSGRAGESLKWPDEHTNMVRLGVYRPGTVWGRTTRHGDPETLAKDRLRPRPGHRSEDKPPRSAFPGHQRRKRSLGGTVGGDPAGASGGGALDAVPRPEVFLMVVGGMSFLC